MAQLFLFRKEVDMDKVYNENGGFTEEASKLANKVRKFLRDLIREELDVNTPVEVLEHVINNTVHMEILTQQLHIRLGKDANGEEIEGE